MKGYKGFTFDAEPGDFLADKDGRSGVVVSVFFDAQLEENVFSVDPGYGGILISLRESLVSYREKSENS
jgi:hypothetical protein